MPSTKMRKVEFDDVNDNGGAHIHGAVDGHVYRYVNDGCQPVMFSVAEY